MWQDIQSALSQAGSGIGSFAGSWTGDRIQDANALFGIHDWDNKRDPKAQAEKNAAIGDYAGLKAAVADLPDDQKKEYASRLNALASKEADARESAAIKKLYGNIPEGEGLVTEIQKRQNAAAIAQMRAAGDEQNRLANTQGSWGFKSADLTSGRQLTAALDSNKTQRDIAGITSEAQKYGARIGLMGVQDTNRTQRDISRDSNRTQRYGIDMQSKESRVAQALSAMGGNRQTTANYYANISNRRSFR
jgi:hypothetical protein